MKTERAVEDRLRVALPILQGLLASGHYTIQADGVEDGCVPSYYVQDRGESWREGGLFSRRYVSYAVMDALELAGQLLSEVGREEDE